MSKQFWVTMDGLAGLADEAAAQQAAIGLAWRGETAIVDFEDGLAAAVESLTTAAFEAAARPCGPPGATVEPLTCNELAHLRLAVIAQGRARYAEILQDPTRLAGVWDLSSGERLWSVSARARELVGSREGAASTARPWASEHGRARTTRSADQPSRSRMSSRTRAASA